MSPRLVVVHPDAEQLARSAGMRLLLTLLDAQSVQRPVHVALTGGSVGTALLAALRDEPLIHAVDWTGVHLWWGDERFLPAGDPDRNDTQAREALLDHLPGPGPHLHPVPGPDRVADVTAAAQAYAAELTAHATPAGGEGAQGNAGEGAPADGGGNRGHGEAPRGGASDVSGSALPEDTPRSLPELLVTLLGVGPDGHVASLFPGKPTVTVVEGTTVAEHDSPKPPPQRVSLTLPALGASRQVWLVAAGEGKAAAVAAGLSGGHSPEVSEAVAPAGLVTGRDLTVWLLDAAAAQEAG